MKPFIGLKKLYYGDVIDIDLTLEAVKHLTGEKISTAEGIKDLKAFTEVKNVHQDTWSYEQDDPNVEDYINELDGKPYYRDATTAGNKTISFTLGVYSIDDKVALCGGKAVDGGKGWKSPDEIPLINKGIIAITKTGNYIVFTNASIIGKNTAQSKNIGLGVTAVAMDNDVADVADEYLFSGEEEVTTSTE